MKNLLLNSLICFLFFSCENEESFSEMNSNHFDSNINKKVANQSYTSFGTVDPITGEFINIDYDTSTLDQVNFPYIDSYNVAFYDNSYLLNNCPNNGKTCIDLAHFVGGYIIPIESRMIPVFYGEYNTGFDNIYGTVNKRIFSEIGSEYLLVTNSWMTNYAANTVLDSFRAEVKNNFQLKNIKAFRIHTRVIFGPSRSIVVEIKTQD